MSLFIYYLYIILLLLFTIIIVYCYIELSFGAVAHMRAIENAFQSALIKYYTYRRYIKVTTPNLTHEI